MMIPPNPRIYHQSGCQYAWAVNLHSAETEAGRVSAQFACSDGRTASLLIEPWAEGVLRIRCLPPGDPEKLSSGFLEVAKQDEAARFTCFAEIDGGIDIQFGEYHLELQRDPFDFIVHRNGHPTVFRLASEHWDGTPLTPALGWRRGGDLPEGIFLSWQHPAHAESYGLGEKWQAVEKKGQSATIEAHDTRGNASTDLAYKPLPLIHTTAGWSLIAATTCPSHWEIGSFSANTGSVFVEESGADFFLVLADPLKSLLRKTADLFGKPAMPPKWALGTWISRCMFRNRAEAEEAMDGFRQRALPADVICLDPAWMRLPHREAAGIDTCELMPDDGAFPGLPRLMKNWATEGFATSLWVNPYIATASELYKEAAAAGFLVRDSRGGFACPVGGTAAGLVDFTHPKAVEWWKGKLHKLLAEGAWVFKADYGEGVPRTALFANGADGKQMRNQYPHLFAKACFEARQTVRGEGFVWRRSGYLGSARFPGTWGGDTPTNWEGLAACIRGGLSASISGEAFWGSDIGGFDGPPPSPELYIRWAQFGCFSGLTRFHGTTPREPWHFGEKAVAIVRHHLEARYRLMPYLLAYAFEASQTGLPLMRPMRLEFPGEPGVQHCDDQYMLGPDLLVAPVLQPGAVSRHIFFPEGIWWRLDQAAPALAGGGYRTVPAPLETIPVFVRDGAVLPRYPSAPAHSRLPAPPRLQIDVYPGETERALDIPDTPHTVQILYRRQGGLGQFFMRPAPLEITLRLVDVDAETDDANQWKHSEIGSELTLDASEGIAFELNKDATDEEDEERTGPDV
jgi:alpha-D-xyloside xylohydrolase